MIETNIRNDLIPAMKAKDKLTTLTLKSMTAVIDRHKIDQAISRDEPLADELVQRLLRTELKRRHEAEAAYADAGRVDLAETEANEAVIIQKYLPTDLSDDELDTIIDVAVAQHGTGNMGLLMKAIMSQTDGRANGKRVQTILQAKRS